MTFDFSFKVGDDAAADFAVFDYAIYEVAGGGFELGFEHDKELGISTR